MCHFLQVQEIVTIFYNTELVTFILKLTLLFSVELKTLVEHPTFRIDVFFCCSICNVIQQKSFGSADIVLIQLYHLCNQAVSVVTFSMLYFIILCMLYFIILL